MTTYITIQGGNGGSGGGDGGPVSPPPGSAGSGQYHSPGSWQAHSPGTVYALSTLNLGYRLIVSPRTGYRITAQVYQTNTNAFFRVVEQTVLNGTWDQVDGAYVLTMPSSGTAGSLRFVSDTGENFIVTLGIHNYKRWGDIGTNLAPELTGVVMTPQYYSDAHRYRGEVREKQLTTYNVNNRKGRNFKFDYTVAEGNDLKVKIIIG